MNIEGMVHVNINCSDYAASKKFYEMLGFEEVWRVPETNTAEVAAAVGMPPYSVNGALLALKGSEPALVIDLLEWREPRDPGAPYPICIILASADWRCAAQIWMQTTFF